MMSHKMFLQIVLAFLDHLGSSLSMDMNYTMSSGESDGRYEIGLISI